MGNPKRQHYLAQTIQKNFLNEGQTLLWYYDRKKDVYEQRTPRGLAHARQLYTFENVEQDQRYALEKAFSVLESKASPIFQKLRDGIEISQAERNTIAEFAGMQYFRTPLKLSLIDSLVERGSKFAMQEMVNKISAMSDEEFQAYIQKYSEETGRDASKLTKESLIDFHRRHPYMQTTKDGRLKTLVDGGSGLGINFSSRAWIVVHAQKGSSFITSDTATFCTPDGPTSEATGHGPGSPGMAVIFPFAQKAALMITSKRQPSIVHAPMSPNYVKKANGDLAMVSNQLYSHSRELLEAVVSRGRLAKTEYAHAFPEEQLRALAIKHYRNKMKP